MIFGDHMKEDREPKYKKLINIFVTLVKRVLPPYSGKFSKKTYTQYQHAAVICLMQYEKKTYRDVVDLLPELADYFGFETSIPHYTTLQKFFNRIPPKIWEFILIKSYQMFGAKVADVGIDSTGYQERHTSYYYIERVLGRHKWRCRNFMKHGIAVDTKLQAIIASINIHRKTNDMQGLIPLLEKSKDVVKIRKVTADKGYDSEENHRYAREVVGAISIIPARGTNSVWRMWGHYRKKMRRNFPETDYHQRSKVETVNSVQKRKFGEELRSKMLWMRKKEMTVKDIVYNVHRYLTITFYLFIVGFLQSLRGGFVEFL